MQAEKLILLLISLSLISTFVSSGPRLSIERVSPSDQIVLSMLLRQALFPSFAFVSSRSGLYQPTIHSRAVLNVSHQLISAALSQLPRAIPIGFILNIPPILSGLWESILRAVPKQRTSHRKIRQRTLAGKAQKDVVSLNKCSACGTIKRAHLLCPFCVKGKLRPRSSWGSG